MSPDLRPGDSQVGRHGRQKPVAYFCRDALVTAAIPAFLLLIIQQTPLALGEPELRYVSVGVFIWAIITLLASFDPQLSTKIDILKDTTQLIPGLGKSQK